MDNNTIDFKLAKFKDMVEESDNIVFFGGAGVSTESGIPDFRSEDGLYNQKSEYKYPPEYMLSHTCYAKDPEEFFKYYKDKFNTFGYEPNAAHKKLAELEQRGKLKAVVTQNVDGLHQRAGSKTVYELHGSALKNYCQSCGKLYSAEDVFNSAEIIPRCTCGGIIKPDVVLYEECLDDDVIQNAVQAIAAADMLIVGGTSLTVTPASTLVRYFKGKYLVLINRDTTPYDNQADLVINDSIGKVFSVIA